MPMNPAQPVRSTFMLSWLRSTGRWRGRGCTAAPSFPAGVEFARNGRSAGCFARAMRQSAQLGVFHEAVEAADGDMNQAGDAVQKAELHDVEADETDERG